MYIEFRLNLFSLPVNNNSKMKVLLYRSLYISDQEFSGQLIFDLSILRKKITNLNKS